MLKSPKFAGPDQLWKMTAHGGERTPNPGVLIPWESVNTDYERVIFDHDNTIYYIRTLEEQGFAVTGRGGYAQQAAFLVDTGDQSQRITISEDDGRQHRIRQWDLYLERGRRYKLRLVL